MRCSLTLKKAGFNNSGSRTKITRRKERRHTLKYRLSETLLKYLLNYQISDSQVSMLSGLKFIPTPVTNECKIRQQLFQDFEQFTRRMRLQYIFHGQNKKNHIRFMLNPTGYHQFSLLLPLRATRKMSKHNLQRLL